MASRLNPYLNFNGTARQALEFYKSVFGGELTLSTFGDMGMASDPSDADKIMHGQLETEAGYTLMCSDTPVHMGYEPAAGFSVSLSGDDAVLREYFEKLAVGGTVSMPMAKQAWGDEFGMCVDQFGIDWMVNLSQPQA